MLGGTAYKEPLIPSPAQGAAPPLEVGNPFPGLRGMEQVLPWDGLGIGGAWGQGAGEPRGWNSPDAIPGFPLISLAVLQRQAACTQAPLSYPITSGPRITARPPFLSLLFPSLQHLLSFPSLPFVFVFLWSGSRSPQPVTIPSVPGLLSRVDLCIGPLFPKAGFYF